MPQVSASKEQLEEMAQEPKKVLGWLKDHKKTNHCGDSCGGCRNVEEAKRTLKILNEGIQTLESSGKKMLQAKEDSSIHSLNFQIRLYRRRHILNEETGQPPVRPTGYKPTCA